MVASIAEAMKKAQAKKGSSHALIHPSFPPQGAEQPAFMGSQSAPPTPGSGGMGMDVSAPNMDGGF